MFIVWQRPLEGIKVLNKGDFIKLEYTGYDDKGNIFDATSGNVSKKLHNRDGPLLIVFGYDLLVVGLQEALANMNKGDAKELLLMPDKAFGQRSKELIRVLSENELLKNNIQPEIGLSLQLDTDQGPLFGVVRSIASGRVTVDFNHPLAGKNVKYSLKLIDVITDKEAKISALMDDMQLKGKSKIAGEKLEVELEKPKADAPENKENNYEVKKQYFAELVKSIIPEIKDVNIKEV